VQTLHGGTVRITRTKVEIDREEQKHRSFTAFAGLRNRTRWLQAWSSTAHASIWGPPRLRRLMLDGAKALRESKEPAAAQRHQSYCLGTDGALAPAGCRSKQW